MSGGEGSYHAHRGLVLVGGHGVLRSPGKTAEGGCGGNRSVPGYGGERWLPVVGWEGLYQVSDLGRVWSCRRPGTRGGMLRPAARSDGGVPYWQVSLCRDGKRSTQRVHRLVLTAFAGPCPEGQEARHGPAGSLVNHWPGNLCWGTSAENAADMFRDGTAAVGSRNGAAKLDDQAVLVCRARAARGESHTSLAREFGVRQPVMTDAITGRSWAHVA